MPRKWPPETVARLVAEYEALPLSGGHRTEYLKKHNLHSAQMSIWRKVQIAPPPPPPIAKLPAAEELDTITRRCVLDLEILRDRMTAALSVLELTLETIKGLSL